jgi:hypothetical protein
VPRGPVVVFGIIFAIAVAVYFGYPALKRSIVGNSLQTRVNVVKAEDVTDAGREVPGGGFEIIPKTVLDMEIFFPMGGAPERIDDLNVLDDSNQTVEVIWKEPIEKEDLPDQRQTRWHIREAFFPIRFRKGTLRKKDEELAYIKVTKIATAHE